MSQLLKFLSLGKAGKSKKKERGTSSSHESSTSSAGSLDPQQQLAAAYNELMQNKGAQEAWKKEYFQQLRILVVGRSGADFAGKTTLIRLLVGDEGPETISEGVAGVQDIEVVFHYSRDKSCAPLLIHDSNGMDVRGKERMDEIKAFLERHQKTENFADHIHIVWYVISAIDPRCAEDGDMMKMIGEFKIPLLLIMTHNDYEKVKVSDASLDKLLEGYGNAEERAAVKKLMVKVKNGGVTIGKNNELLIDETKEDTEGLEKVAKLTQNLMDKRLRHTWVAAQAVNIDGKLDLSAGIVAGYARKALLTALPRAIPFADPVKLTIIFNRVITVMCQIWLVPPELGEAIRETLTKEGTTKVLKRVGEDMLYAAGLAVTIGATVLTAGAALPSVIVMLAGSGVLSVGKAVPILVKTFSLQVLATILYVKSQQAVGSSKHRWNPNVSKEEYVKLCEDFAHNERYQKMLQKFAKEHHSLVDTALRKKKVKGIVKSKILEIYNSLLQLHRPSSLKAQFLTNDAVDSNDNTSAPEVADLADTATLAADHTRDETDDEDNDVDELEDVGADAADVLF